MKKWKKVISVALSVAMIAVALTACGNKESTGDSGSGDSSSDKAKVVFAYWGAESENAAITKAVDDFRDNHPDIEVETQWMESDYLTKVQTQIAGKTMADVYLMSGGDLSGFSDNFDAQDVDVSMYISENVVDALKVDGEVMARPFIAKPKVTAINKDLFAENNVAVPEPGTIMTIEEYYNAIAAMTDASKEPQQFGSEAPWTGALMYSFDSSFYIENGTRSNLASPEAIAMADFIIDIKEKGFVPDNVQTEGQSMMEWFLSERIAIYTDFGHGTFHKWLKCKDSSGI